MTHTLTHTGKRADGNSGYKSAGKYAGVEQKGLKSIKKPPTISFPAVGKDEVSSSNLDSSSTKTALFSQKGRFYFAFCDIYARLEIVVRTLTTEQATDRKNRGPSGTVPPGPRCIFSRLLPVLSSKQSPASSRRSAPPVFPHILPAWWRRYCEPCACR